MEYIFYYLMLILIIIGSILELMKGLYDFFLTEKWTESEMRGDENE